MFSTITSIALKAALAVLAKLATEAFFEKIATDLFLWFGDKLAASTSTLLDDTWMNDARKKLGEKPDV